MVEEGLHEPFHARDWLENYGQGPCGTLTIALSPCAILGNLQFWGTCNWGELAIGSLAAMLGLAAILDLAVTLGLAGTLGLAHGLKAMVKVPQGP